MQEPKKIKRTKRRKDGRTKTADLKALSSNAYALRSVSKRLYATIRLSIIKKNFERLTKAARFFGLTLSATARRVLAIEEAESHAAKQRRVSYFEEKTRKGTRPPKQRRRTYTAADLWAKEGKTASHRLINLRLTAYDLAEIETHREEGKTNGNLYGRSYSAAFGSLLMFGLLIVDRLITAYEMGRFIGIDPKDREKPTREKRNRTYTEIKRRIIEEGYTTSL